jgi:ribonuclease D
MTDGRRCGSTDSASPGLVSGNGQLADLIDDLQSQPSVAVDTESNSLYAYRERVCLIQFSTRSGDYLVDPLADLDLSPLGAVFSDSAIEKVFHAAEYDVMTMRRDFGFDFANLFDTMWAARILGWPKVGLGSILQSTFDIHTNKRYQRYDWGKRPIDEGAQTYACMDTHYLLDLRDLQAGALRTRGRWEEAQEVFEQVALSEAAPRAFDPQDFRRVKGSSKLKSAEQAVLFQLYMWRDREARRRDTPPFKVLGNGTLKTLAITRPRTAADMAGIRGLRPHHIRRYGDQILRAVKLGARVKPPPPPPPPPRHSREEMQRFRALQAWRKEMGAQRGVDPDVVVGNPVLWALAEKNPRTVEELAAIEGLGPWKRREYGDQMLRILHGRKRRGKS